MEISIRVLLDPDCEPITETEILDKKIYEEIFNIYRATGKCPYCGSSVIDLKNGSKWPVQNNVLDGGWYNYLKCENCNCMPMLKENIHYLIDQEIIRKLIGVKI